MAKCRLQALLALQGEELTCYLLRPVHARCYQEDLGRNLCECTNRGQDG